MQYISDSEREGFILNEDRNINFTFEVYYDKEDLSLIIAQEKNVIRLLPPNLNELSDALIALSSIYRKFVSYGLTMEVLDGNSSSES